MIVTGYRPEVAASVYNIQLYKEIERHESTRKTCCVCGADFFPEDGGKEVWVRKIKSSRYICPHCWGNAEEIEEGE